MEFTNVVDKKLVENEVVVRKILLKGGNGEGLKSDELRALKEKNLLDYVDTMIKNLKHEVISELDDEKSKKNMKIEQIT